jgi:hypothetical protein
MPQILPRRDPFWSSYLKPWLDFVMRYLFAIFLGVIVPVVLQGETTDAFGHKIPTYTLGEQITIGLLVAIAGVLVVASAEIKRLTLARMHQDEEDEATIAGMSELKQIADGIGEVSFREPSQLLTYMLQRKLHNLANEVSETANSLVYQLTPKLDDTRAMLDHARGENIQAVHYLDNDAFVTRNRHSKRFWEEVHGDLRSGNIRSVQRLMVLASDPDDARRQMWNMDNRRLIGMHLYELHYDCRIIQSRVFEEFQTQYRFHGVRLDFGLYGKRFVYVSHQLPDAEPGTGEADAVGRLVGNPERIADYARLFKVCWEEATPPDRVRERFGIPPFPKVTLWDFLHPDEPKTTGWKRVLNVIRGNNDDGAGGGAGMPGGAHPAVATPAGDTGGGGPAGGQNGQGLA